MNKKQLFIGTQKVEINNSPVKGDFTNINDETFYKISNFDKMSPFLISIVSATDHWMYISSTGGITAGRKNSDNAIFPYTNDDILHDIQEITGSKTIVKILGNKKLYLWEPFSEYYSGIYSVTRNLYKNISSTQIIFEEINHDLKIKFQYGWTCSEKYGFIKTSNIFNESKSKKEIEILDGIQNILPSGVSQQLQSGFSTLIDGYKKNELIVDAGVGLFSLSSIPSDRAQPAESLKATTVWTAGVYVEKYLLCSNQISKFRKNSPVVQENSINGIRGSFLITSRFKIEPQSSVNWLFAAEVNQNAGSLVELIKTKKEKNAYEQVVNDFKESNQRLTNIVAQSDGLQLTENKLGTARHFSNVLFNVMRGGIFNNSYFIEKHDFISFVKNANPFVLNVHRKFLETLQDQISNSELLSKVSEIGDSHFTRLAIEYMPLTFSRRHGDPSRPWNQFSIDIKNKNNEKILNYQGNWRDIFQNWEALALSYPKFLESMIAKFLNDSTADGYNPYRVFRDGFDWEEQEPHNPWANIGYWGDHQIIYSLKLLELSKEFNPHSLEQLLDTDIFTFANVPYRIKEYQEILKDPRNTIVFDYELDKQLKTEEKLYGSDSKFLKKADHSLVQVNLIEKLLLTLLTKMSNFIPGGGIWMNTQRPEWNDAKNALVGYGVSMVTLYYIRRYVNFIKELLNESSKNKFYLSNEIAEFFNGINGVIFEVYKSGKGVKGGRDRKYIVDQLSIAGSEYRTKIYLQGFTGEKQEISTANILEFCDSSLSLIDQTIEENRREDGLYHAYNILHISDGEFKVTHLYEMLEGQVAVLSSGYLSTKNSIELLTALKKSRLYRQDQNSYMLYPNKKLAHFFDKNNIDKDLVKNSKLFTLMLSEENKTIIYKDIDGGIHFNSDIINSDELKIKLKSLADVKLKKYAEEEISLIVDIYEKTFNHGEFTGRANTFYKYEGLGSIYWHMVSKQLLAVQEVYFNAEKISSDKKQLEKLKDFYFDIKNGIGESKQPDQYGAFPTDPYSHTPSFAGVQQPGMTGQVKEDIISRFREIGIKIKSGKIFINPSLLRKKEFLKKQEVFTYFDFAGKEQNINCKKDSFAITYCQVPFVFKLSEEAKVVVIKENGEEIQFKNLALDEKTSQLIFKRTGEINRVEVFVNKNL
ncbi:MAG: hypothetical protein MUF28_02175 [Ignavibacterium sp.]|jgi:hypothetical protein|nr:hypothetical protein [Ignavibacterium sp.]